MSTRDKLHHIRYAFASQFDQESEYDIRFDKFNKKYVRKKLAWRNEHQLTGYDERNFLAAVKPTGRVNVKSQQLLHSTSPGLSV